MNRPSSIPSPAGGCDPKGKPSDAPQNLSDVVGQTGSLEGLDIIRQQAEHKPTPEFEAMEIAKKLEGRADSERHDICLSILQRMGCRVESVDYVLGKNIVCTFSANPTHKIVLGAHYDRVEEAPGANDNGAAVAQLVLLACDVALSGIDHRDLTIVLFDNEETMAIEPKASGSRYFAQCLKDSMCQPKKIVVLDVTGTGDTVVMSTSVTASQKLRARIRSDLDSCYIPSVEMWTPTSDSKMFNQAGYECILLSMLPSASLRLLEPTEQANRWNYDDNEFPAEWLKLHSEHDDFSSLTPEAFVIMHKALRRIAEIPQQ